jgi:uncharacterized protein with PIN domain
MSFVGSRGVSVPATLIVRGWDASRAWFPGMDGYVKEMLMKHLQLSSPMSRTEAKAIVKRTLARELVQIDLADGQYADSMRHWLESIGAQVEALNGVQGDQAAQDHAVRT